MKSLIFCPVGIPVHTYPALYDENNHWRFTKPERLYDTVVYQYKDDFVPEPGTYDFIEKAKGYKWEIAKHFLDTFDYSGYEYIGFFDDDVITDIESVNHAITLATEKNIKLFQLSLADGSERSHHILFQDKSLKYSITSFNEGMGCFIHVSLIPIFLEFCKFHQPKSGCGLDLIMAHITKEQAMVIHERSMFHPPREFYGYVSKYYDQSAADSEMYHILGNVYPQFMRHKYGQDTGPFNIPHTVHALVFNN